MRYMAVPVARIVPVVEPLLQLSPTAHLHGGQLRNYRAQRIDKETLLTHHLRGVDGIGEKVVDHLIVHRSTGYNDKRTFAVDRRCIFGRI